jgi:hypothetical protein
MRLLLDIGQFVEDVNGEMRWMLRIMIDRLLSDDRGRSLSSSVAVSIIFWKIS